MELLPTRHCWGQEHGSKPHAIPFMRRVINLDIKKVVGVKTIEDVGGGQVCIRN
jgi:hypothetical protein